jgi:hypothetical protein
MRNLGMVLLSVAATAALGSTLWRFLLRLRRIEDEFWGAQRTRVNDATPPAEGGAKPESQPGDRTAWPNAAEPQRP